MKGTRFLAFLLAFIMAFSSVGVADVSAAEMKTETLSGNAVSEEVSIVSDEISVELDTSELPDNEELYAGYVERLFYSDLYGDMSAYANVGVNKLSGQDKAVYDGLKAAIEQIAAGQRTSTVINLGETVTWTWTAEELGVDAFTNDNAKALGENAMMQVFDLHKIVSYLLMDCPYELYWFDKTVATSYGFSISGTSSAITILNLTVRFNVASAFQAGDAFTFDTSYVEAAVAAKANAQEILESYKDKSDYEKLLGFKNEICNLVDYNKAAADSSTQTAYGDPWQMIWVFDENAETKVVCEGYSKAFQYLCDMSDLTCYTVTGYMNGGKHMWNIVTLAGNNYLVDVTNCDDGTIGQNGELFLAGISGSYDTGYTFALSKNITYVYDDDQESLLGSDVLTLTEASYNPNGDVTEPDSGSDEPDEGDAVVTVEIPLRTEGYSWIYNEETLEVPLNLNVPENSEVNVRIGRYKEEEERFVDYPEDTFVYDKETSTVTLFGNKLAAVEDVQTVGGFNFYVQVTNGEKELKDFAWWFEMKTQWINIEYPLSSPGDNQMLVGESRFIEPHMRSWGENSEHPQNEERWIEIKDVYIESQYAYTDAPDPVPVEGGIIEIIPNEDGGWHIEGRDHGYANIVISYVDWFYGEEKNYPFEVFSVGDYYRLDLDYQDGTNSMLTGDVKEIQTRVIKRYLSENGHEEESVEDYNLEFSVGENDEYDTTCMRDSATFTIDENDKSKIIVTADANETGEQNVWIRATGNAGENSFEVGNELYVDVTESYINIMTKKALGNVMIGETIDFDDYIEVWAYGGAAGEGLELLGKDSYDINEYDFRYMLEYNDNEWEYVESDSGHSLKRVSPEGTEIKVIAQADFPGDQEENWGEVCRRHFWFDGMNGVCAYGLSDGDHGVIYEDTDVALNTKSISGNENVELKFILGIWDEEEFVPFDNSEDLYEEKYTEGVPYATSVTLDYEGLKELKENKQLRDEDWCEFAIELWEKNYLVNTSYHSIRVGDVQEDYHYKFEDDIFMNPG